MFPRLLELTSISFQCNLVDFLALFSFLSKACMSSNLKIQTQHLRGSETGSAMRSVNDSVFLEA